MTRTLSGMGPSHASSAAADTRTSAWNLIGQVAGRMASAGPGGFVTGALKAAAVASLAPLGTVAAVCLTAFDIADRLQTGDPVPRRELMARLQFLATISNGGVLLYQLSRILGERHPLVTGLEAALERHQHHLMGVMTGDA